MPGQTSVTTSVTPSITTVSIGPYDPVAQEEAILKYWVKEGIYEAAKQKTSKGPDFYFLDGPPYTSGKVHIGTAWNKALKDMVLRFKRMQGFNVWDRAGYDMHGLPTEHATEKKLGIKGKEAILQFGIEQFVEECRKLSVDNMLIMNKDFERMGVWMDFDNPYQSIKKEFIEGVWWLIKQAHEKNRLYEGLRTMTWCANCTTAIAKHELEYTDVKEPSIFVKFPVLGEENTFLVIWTTTPWT
ncbi:class I tRNA ligase family protein, partial [Candidatus Woesearchaeota archaeon]|nr:class I tRNA ligase family protein [Candidatus Woesearchaeota archaeon]